MAMIVEVEKMKCVSKTECALLEKLYPDVNGDQMRFWKKARPPEGGWTRYVGQLESGDGILLVDIFD